MTIFQLFAVLFALFMWYVVNIHHRKGVLSPLEVGFWYSTWFVFIVIAIAPNLLLGVANLFHFARVFDMLVFIAMMIISLLVISNYFSQKENTHKIDKLVRQQALEHGKKTKS